jgi:hypothetical protein
LKISGSYPYKTEGKIIIPYILIFTTWERTKENERHGIEILQTLPIFIYY